MSRSTLILWLLVALVLGIWIGLHIQLPTQPPPRPRRSRRQPMATRKRGATIEPLWDDTQREGQAV